MALSLSRDRMTWVVGGVLTVLALGAWVVVIRQATAPMTISGGLIEGGLFLGAWGVMMAAMMLPSAVPMIALYGAMRRSAAGAATASVSTGLFAAVYLLVWLAVGVPVYVASLLLGGWSGGADLLPYLLAAVLVAAGAYQLTPLKRAYLRACRSPLSFLLARQRAGYRGTLALAFAHAAYCLSCCWALMVVLVAAGAMALNWVLLVAAVVFAEKLLPWGEWTARVVGGTLVLLGMAVAARPELAMALRPSMG